MRNGSSRVSLPSSQGGSDPEASFKLEIGHLTADQQMDIVSHVRGISDDGPETYPMPAHGWTCFHCGANFRTPGGARLHFGEAVTGRPVCVTPPAGAPHPELEAISGRLA